MEKFKKAFRRLPDPRAYNARHELLEVLFIALAATLCGAEGPSDMATFGQSKEGLLRLVLQLQHGVPSHDTFSRVFRLLDPQAFEAAFRRFMAGFAKANGLELRGVVAVDGKALRGAFERGRQSTPLHMVNVWAAEARMCLAQRKAPGRNEAAGALEVLGLLDLEGCIVTADALHCHRDFASTVLERGADYVLALKENQSKLFAAAARRYARSGARSVAVQREPATHDRCDHKGEGNRPNSWHHLHGHHASLRRTRRKRTPAVTTSRRSRLPPGSSSFRARRRSARGRRRTRSRCCPCCP